MSEAKRALQLRVADMCTDQLIELAYVLAPQTDNPSLALQSAVLREAEIRLGENEFTMLCDVLDALDALA